MPRSRTPRSPSRAGASARSPSGPTPRGPRLWLTPAGRTLALTGLTFLLVGVAFDRPIATALGGLPLVLLTWAYAVARVARHRLRHGGLIATLRPGVAEPGELRIPLGRALTLPFRLDVAPGLSPRVVTLSPAPVAPLEAAVTMTAAAPPAEGTLQLTPRRVGDAFFQGFVASAEVAHGLFGVRVWVPARARVTVLPRRYAARPDAPLRATRTSLQERAGADHTRRRGTGMEIRELRDHQAGDPFKHIAWRASARRGKLIAREFESDLVLSTFVLVDASPSMFWGPPGRARIDYVLEAAHHLLDLVVGRGDRAGLVVYDEAVRLEVTPGRGRPQLVRLLEALLEVPHLVHEGRTELTDRELVERAAAWLEAQDGVTCRVATRDPKRADPRASPHDLARLVQLAQRRLDAELVARDLSRPVVPLFSYARDPQRAILRAFCRHLGVPLPLDPTPRPGAQARGLEAAMEHVLTARGGPHAIVIMSDLYSADDLEALRHIAAAARRHRHSVVVVCPDHPGFEGAAAGADALEDAVLDVARLRVSHSLELAQAALRPAGVTFLRCGPEDVVPRLLQRLRQVA